ncbi:LAQU0S07e01244g1_1 [Lachancea quebecensis]|uniref:LAQU0S07e01244g1_1 n=1 Tax=Lachancea quebecensis TaxID=1654605 RepID=A0A0P1KSU7_9SACH|nr:LAQU0S07e01244g1_1 [Lachancea quebecensis]
MATKNLHLVDIFEEDDKKYVRIPKKTNTSSLKVSPKDFTIHDRSDFNGVVTKLETYGLCIIKNYLATKDCEKIKDELKPHYFRDESWNGSPFPKQTTVVARTVLKSRTCLDKIATDDMFCDVSQHFLAESNMFWIGEGLRRGVSGVHLNSGIVYRVGPGAGNQMWHREDMVHHNVHPRRDQYHYGDDSHVGFAVALTKMTKENGATRAIVGSHLWGPLDGPGDFDKGAEVYLEMDEGDVAFMLGSVYHAASANTSAEERIAAYFFMNKSYLKQEENYHIDQDPAYFRSLPLKALSVLGLHVSEPFCGHIDYKSPAFLINPELEVGARQEKYTEVLYPRFE